MTGHFSANLTSTLRELFRHDDWARDLLLNAAAPLSDDQLRREFPMGPGSLMRTLTHMHETAYWWFSVCRGQPAQDEPRIDGLASLAQQWDATSAQRDELLVDGDLNQWITYQSWDAKTLTRRKVELLMHVVNHGMHHRAQALNMLRHLGATPPRVDYIFMKLNQPDSPALAVAVIRDFYRYNDWAQQRVLALCAALSDQQLDQPFEIGLGTLRRTLVHINDAQTWWFGNWTSGPDRTFPKPDETASIEAIAERDQRIAQQRNAHLEALNDSDLTRVVTAQPVADMYRSFPLGQTMLQLCNHGTHHRAQAINMLRHLGAAPIKMDYLVRLRELDESSG